MRCKSLYYAAMQPKPLLPEELVHIECVNFLRSFCPRIFWWHNPNENKLLNMLPAYRRKALQKKMYEMGLRAGVLDLTLHWLESGATAGKTLYVEIKANGEKPRGNQESMIAKLDELHIPNDWCDSFEDFITILMRERAPIRHGIYSRCDFREYEFGHL